MTNIRPTDDALREQSIPIAFQRAFQPKQRRHYDIQLAGFDLLNCPRVKFGKLREPFLGDTALDTFPAQIDTQAHQLGVFTTTLRHAPLRRPFRIDRHGPMGRNLEFPIDGVENNQHGKIS